MLSASVLSSCPITSVPRPWISRLLQTRTQRSKHTSVQGMAEDKWWSADTVAVVTGANKGIGYEIARQLAQAGLTVIATARDEARGMEALQKLKTQLSDAAKEHVFFHKLDIDDKQSVHNFADWLKQQHGHVDVLINNAGFAFKGDVFGADEAQTTLNTNFYGTQEVCEQLKPLLKPNVSRIVNVSSRAGLLRIISGQQLKQQIEHPESKKQLNQLAKDLVNGIKEGTHRQQGWPNSMYGVSKLLLSAYTKKLADELQPQDIMVNACCPGYVATDMSSHRGTKTPEEGADTPVWLALLPEKSFTTGGMFAERNQIDF